MPDVPATTPPPSSPDEVADRRGAPVSLAGITVLQLIPALETGGAERTTIDIAAALAEAGARALVATQGGRLVGELQARGGLWIPFPAATKNPLRMWSNAARLVELAREENVDIIHARSRAPAWSGLWASRRLRMPFVTTYHGTYSAGNALKRRYNSIMARGDAVIANSAFTGRAIAQTWPEAAPRLHVIPRGTDLAAFTPAVVSLDRVEALRQAWGVAPHQRVVLLPGRLTGWKGQRVLIEAAAILVADGLEDAVFVLAGDHQGRDGYVAELDALVLEKKLVGIVRRVGHCADMPAAYLAAAAAAIPSTSPEAFGRTAVEAQAMGCPVVVADHGATPETVLAPPETPALVRTGWRVPPSDPVALAEALGEALSLGASAREVMALRARAHVEEHFSLEAMCRSTLAVYAELLQAGM
ncbi:glycosyltransferase family 4 protein [Labrys wisconsinensis]|uniref:Glycosyltransferase involved in cell wall biosynthesis n=1 Tax=Labrys wisconsinensis TaxID=425677 RepID=A0ABU0JKL5_9HYPH|nr:glycosyltransferase family 4 protein [Labrys wisconsinensis]MDQ0473804.1 glycosyltransferase involved in cell wall biosynthesis [Labrys wisconsinensis]